MLNTKLIAKFARLYLARKKLKEKATQINKELENMQGPLLDHIIDEGLNKVSFPGGITVSIDKKIWPKYLAKDEFGQTDKHAIATALKEAGLNEYVEEGYNTNSIAAYLRELDRDKTNLPEALKGIIEPNSVNKLVAKKFK